MYTQHYLYFLENTAVLHPSIQVYTLISPMGPTHLQIQPRVLHWFMETTGKADTSLHEEEIITRRRASVRWAASDGGVLREAVTCTGVAWWEQEEEGAGR